MRLANDRRNTTIRRAAWPLLAVCVGATVLTGCGGDNDGKQGAEKAVEAYFTGLANGDGKQACAVLNLDMQGELVTAAVRATGQALGQLDRDRCEVALERLSDAMDSANKSALRDAHATADVDGDRATVTVEGASRTATVRKQDGRWLITAGLTGGE